MFGDGCDGGSGAGGAVIPGGGDGTNRTHASPRGTPPASDLRISRTTDRWTACRRNVRRPASSCGNRARYRPKPNLLLFDDPTMGAGSDHRDYRQR